MRRQDRRPDLGIERRYAAVGVALICFVAMLAAPYLTALPLPASAGVVPWPPAGIALALLLVIGYDVWPAVFAGFAGAGVVEAGAGSAAVMVAAAATAQACAGSWLINRWACGAGMVGRTRSFVRFAVGGGLIAAALGPAFGIPVLTLIGVNLPSPGGLVGLVLSWWIGDGVSTLALAPAILLSVHPTPTQASRNRGEILALAAALGLSFLGLLTPASLMGAANYPLEVLSIPPLLWTAYRFGPRAAALAVVALVIVANAGTQAGLGPFAAPTAGGEVASRTALNAFLAVNAVTTLVLAMVTAERRAAEAQLLVLARTDGLTGLSNYRAAMDALQHEVARRMRRGHNFAVLFFDLDGLKKINDTHGHLAGNRAIVRLADAIAVNCRSIDTPARIGGDEFCVILPGANEVMAWHVADRVTRALGVSTAGSGAGSPGGFAVRASAGVAMYPRDGATAEELLGAADSVLYGAKRTGRAVTLLAPAMVRAGTPA